MITSLILVLALIIAISFAPQPNDNIVISTLDGAAAVLGESKED